jgi:hypothetical protein
MELSYYLNKFQIIADQLAVTILNKTQVEIKAGTWIESVSVKLQKKAWANAAPSASAIFFSAWINDKAIKENKLFYNIHALKLRELNGYSITSREFAAAFRKKFIHFEHEWPNVSTAFGPLTLMEGWEKTDPENPGDTITGLVSRFLKIDFIIDTLLDERKTPGTKITNHIK